MRMERVFLCLLGEGEKEHVDIETSPYFSGVIWYYIAIYRGRAIGRATSVHARRYKILLGCSLLDRSDFLFSRHPVSFHRG